MKVVFCKYKKVHLGDEIRLKAVHVVQYAISDSVVSTGMKHSSIDSIARTSLMPSAKIIFSIIESMYDPHLPSTMS